MITRERPYLSEETSSHVGEYHNRGWQLTLVQARTWWNALYKILEEHFSPLINKKMNTLMSWIHFNFGLNSNVPLNEIIWNFQRVPVDIVPKPLWRIKSIQVRAALSENGIFMKSSFKCSQTESRICIQIRYMNRKALRFDLLETNRFKCSCEREGITKEIYGKFIKQCL